MFDTRLISLINHRIRKIIQNEHQFTEFLLEMSNSFSDHKNNSRVKKYFEIG